MATKENFNYIDYNFFVSQMKTYLWLRIIFCNKRKKSYNKGFLPMIFHFSLYAQLFVKPYHKCIFLTTKTC